MTIDDWSITELARLLRKSRPTVYKYITDYKDKKFDNVPNSVKELFDLIVSDKGKSEIYAYCEKNFFQSEVMGTTMQEVVRLIVENEKLLDATKLKKLILKEIENAKGSDE